jgi:hypothetical protein
MWLLNETKLAFAALITPFVNFAFIATMAFS